MVTKRVIDVEGKRKGENGENEEERVRGRGNIPM